MAGVRVNPRLLILSEPGESQNVRKSPEALVSNAPTAAPHELCRTSALRFWERTDGAHWSYEIEYSTNFATPC